MVQSLKQTHKQELLLTLIGIRLANMTSIEYNMSIKIEKEQI